MPLPRTLTSIRHGESESNIAKWLAESGKAHPREAELMATHTSRRRLTAKGILQAKRAGVWLRAYFLQDAIRRGIVPYSTVRGYVSPYARTMETGGYLDLPINWRPDARLSERNWGDLDQLTYEERQSKYGTLHQREQHGIYWPAGNGETLQMLGTRLWQHFHMLAQDHADDDVIDVSHGETILTKRFLLERWLPEDLVNKMISTDRILARTILGREPDRQQKMINCRIIQHTREREDGTLSNSYCRVRLIDPERPDDPAWNLDWTPIVRRTFTSNELLEYVEQFPHYLADVA